MGRHWRPLGRSWGTLGSSWGTLWTPKIRKTRSKLAPKLEFLEFRARPYSQQLISTLQGSTLDSPRAARDRFCTLFGLTFGFQTRALSLYKVCPKCVQSLSKVCPRFVQSLSNVDQTVASHRWNHVAIRQLFARAAVTVQRSKLYT